jgi:uncharacterized protein YegP (UPF0339 family)
MTEHPTPRFEIVHKPREYDGHDGAYDNDQPWSARFIGANGEQVWRTSETYVGVRDVEHAIALLAEALGSQTLFESTVVDDRHTLIVESATGGRRFLVPVLVVEVGP